MKKVTIIDYGMSNLLSISRAMEKIGTEVIITEKPEQIAKADILILPGVGAFYDGMQELKKRDIPESIHQFIKTGKPFLGICLGMQMMLEEGTEITTTKGLGIIDGKVLPLPEKNKVGHQNTIPHIGWSTVKINESRNETLIINNNYMYFVHSYYAMPTHAENSYATSQFSDFYFTCMVNKNNAWGTQFHPEKSGEAGLLLLENFIAL